MPQQNGKTGNGGGGFRPAEALRDACVRVLGADGDLKALALVAALLLFQAIHPKVNTTAVFEVPVQAVSENARCLVTGVEPATVRVKLRGAVDAMAELAGRELSARAVSANPDFLSRETVPVDASGVAENARLRVVSVSPASVEVRLDRLGNWVTTNYVAQPRLVGQPLQSHAAVVMPQGLEVKAFGSIKKLEEFSRKGIRLPTSSIDVEGKTQSFVTSVEIRIPPDSGITSLSPSNFLVSVELTPIRLRNQGGEAVSAPTILSQEEAEAVAAADSDSAEAQDSSAAAEMASPAAGAVADGATAEGGEALAGELLTEEEKEAAAAAATSSGESEPIVPQTP